MRRLRGRARLGLVLAYLVTLGVVADPSPAAAQWAYTAQAGPQADASASLPAPSGLGGTLGCPATSASDTEVNLTWTGSNALDADGNYQVGYYGIWRGTDGGAAGLFGSASGTPPATVLTDNTANDTGANALPAPAYIFVSGNTLGSLSNGTPGVVGTYNFGSEENLLAATPDGTKVFAAESGGGAHSVLEVGALPTASDFDQVDSTITLAGTGPVPIAVAVAPNGSDLYVLDKTNNQVDIVPLPLVSSTYTVPPSATVAVGQVGDPAAMAVSPGSSQLVVADYPAGTLTIVDTSTRATTTVALNRPTGGAAPQPSAVVIDPAGLDAYVLDAANDQVDVVALSGASFGQVTAEVAVGKQNGAVETPADMDVANNATNGDEVYVGNPRSKSVSVISTTTLAVTTVALGAHPNALVAAPDGCYVAVAEGNGAHAKVTTISTTTNAITSTTGAGAAASTIAVPGNSSGALPHNGAVVAMPTQLSYQLQSASTPTGGGFMSAFSAPVTVTLGRGQVP